MKITGAHLYLDRVITLDRMTRLFKTSRSLPQTGASPSAENPAERQVGTQAMLGADAFDFIREYGYGFGLPTGVMNEGCPHQPMNQARRVIQSTP